GPLRREMESLARDLGVESRWTGAIPADRVRAELNRATVLLAPSTVSPDGQREGLGLSLVEAQASGIPVVASRSGGIPEAVRDGVTGLLAEEGAVEETAEHVLRLLRDVDLRRRLGEAGQRHARDEFDLGEQSLKLARIYETTCGAEGN
ncbi:MAG: hypothetical protein RL413_349, partial [Actinomycetota bacterium]